MIMLWRHDYPPLLRISALSLRIFSNSTYYIMEMYYISLPSTPITSSKMMNKRCTDEQVGKPVEAGARC